MGCLRRDSCGIRDDERVPLLLQCLELVARLLRQHQDRAVGRPAASRLLDLADPPTAIFAFNDNLAIGAMRAAQARDLTVPDELSVVGFDDTEEAAIVTPALTTVRQPLAEMGRMAVSLLTRLLEQQRVEALRVELATRLIVRNSTAPPPS
jgi:LacI family transcriptional regulator